MAEPEFNLLEEPWIRVMTKDHKIKELSLTDTLHRMLQYFDYVWQHCIRFSIATM